jgi:hypothetical protein
VSRCGGRGLLEKNLILACIVGVRDFIKTKNEMDLDERCCFYSIS